MPIYRLARRATAHQYFLVEAPVLEQAVAAVNRDEVSPYGTVVDETWNAMLVEEISPEHAHALAAVHNWLTHQVVAPETQEEEDITNG